MGSTAADWRRQHMGAARERVRVARALEELPRLAEALARGELSYAKVRALTRVATPETEERLLTIGRAGTAEHVDRIVRGWRRLDRKEEARETARQHACRALHVYQDEDGTMVIRGRLEPEAGATLIQALNAARDALYRRAQTGPDDVPAETPTMAQQQADALVLVAETALHHGIDPAPPPSAIRSSCTSIPRCSRTPIRRGSPSWKAARAFPRTRRSAWHATRAGW